VLCRWCSILQSKRMKSRVGSSGRDD